ncbi:membrane protein oxaA [Enterococcus phoeniculicola]|uniref:Membrane protein insertase YidC n=1 Tax=Enterococcus phoeniculicola ATCC BAA-412 TaxID=1158610 RepID=R3WMX0_9ENTE|nr:YidC/Oxa1 family membrane protein insertase [Enterococcus phoeniculicola]EOL49206.1 membrane protein oxaA [Enterococcus phoeniculicola ATCC BAA-412]EOT71376.1 membrane protein oxaA [Enterococcus phoeniculicola ATCC BAA-412]OJG69570.1 membrane protein oxaA [Enterococcus phoeniculicola]
MKKYKRLLLMAGLVMLVIVLSACGATGEVNAQSTGVWDRYIVYYFAEAIKALSFGNPGIGIILFTLIIRVILLPLMHFQTKSMRKTQELQPKLKAIQQKYASKDPETQAKLREEQQKLYAENNVNPYAGCLPLLVQMPILMALWQSISRVPELKSGQFLWLNLGNPDPIFLLPILAAVFTFASTYLSSMSQIEPNPSMKIMNFAMPLMILVMGINLASGLSLYWVISNAFQVGQTLLLNNPFKIRKEREEEAQKIRDKERALQRAQNPKKKRKK